MVRCHTTFFGPAFDQIMASCCYHTPKVVEDLLEGTVERSSRAPPRQSEAFTFLGFRSYDPQLQPLLHVVQLASSVSDTHNAIYDEAALVGSAS